MDQDASSEMEALEAEFRFLDEKRRRLQIQKEERLQQAIETYENDRQADQTDIKNKKLALQELEAKYNEELRIKREALQTVLQRDADRKRKHEAEVENLNQFISGLKRLKQANLEVPPVIPQTLAPSALAPGSAQRPLDGAPLGRTDASSTTEPAHVFDEEPKDKLNQCIWDDEQRPVVSECGPAQRSPTTANRCLPLSQPIHDDKPEVARVGTTAGDDTREPQQDYYPGMDELSDSSYVEDPSDEESVAEDGGLMGNGHSSSTQAQPRPLALTKKTIAYDEVYEAARDSQAKYKHWIVEYPKKSGNWYIVRCVEHRLNWEKNVLQAAGKHILGRGHMCSSRKANSAIRELGELVEDCDQQKADASNAEYQKALNRGYKPNNIMKNAPRKGQSKPAQKPKNSAKRRTNHGSDRESIGVFEGVIDPVVGEIYHAWWYGETRSWYSVVILPYSGDGDWKEVGITGNLFSSGLGKEIPDCFKVAKVTTDAGQEAMRLSWAKGYQDGGSKVRSRKFPCLFLHDPLEIPNADQEFALNDKAEVLAFRTAQELRHRSTTLPPGQSKAGVDAHTRLARDFEARLRAIRARQNSAPEQEDENKDNALASTMEDQQPNATASVQSKQTPCPSPASNAQDPHHHSSESYLSMSGNGRSDTPDRYGLTAWNPRVSLPSHLGNSLVGRYRSTQSADLDRRAIMSTYNSVTPATSTTYHPSQNGRAGDESSAQSWTSQAASRQSQSVALKSQNVDSPFALQQSSSRSQTAGCASQTPRAASALAGERRGPTALRPFRPLKETEKRSDGSPQQDRASGLRKTVNTVDRDAVPNSAGQTSWASSYAEMLRQPWRSPDTGDRRPENW